MSKGSSNKHEFDRANFISKGFFTWTYSLLRKGYHGNLSSKEVTDIPCGYDCNELTDRLKRGLKKYTKKTFTAMSMMQSIWYLNLHNMILSLSLTALEEWILKPSIAVSLGLLLRQINVPIRDPFQELQIVLIMSFMFMLQPFTYNYSVFVDKTSAIRARNAMISMIYEKALKLSYQGYKETNAGQIVNFVTNDVNELDTTFENLKYIVIAPVQSLIVAVIVWYEMGSYSVIGLLAFLLLIAMQSSVGNVLVKLRKLKLEATDKRVKLMNEILAGIKVIKIYGWEDRFLKTLSARRKDECGILRKISLINSVNNGIMRTSIKLLILFTLSLYLFGDTGIVSAEKIFFMLSLFYSVRSSIPVFFLRGVTQVSQVYSSLERISVFLNLEEVTPTPSFGDNFSYPQVSAVNAYASWNKEESVLENINFSLQENDFLTIIGPVGSGKTSLLMLILRELHVSSGTVNVHGSIGYVPQESWVFSDTILNNIAFGKNVDYEKIKKVLKYTDFRQDVDSFPNGLDTLVGEKGTKLSGGQRSRLSLARALYLDTDIYLLDDPLSAVDSEVGNRLYNQCIQKYLRNKLRVLVTHQIQYIRNDQKVILMNKGSIEMSGTFEEIRNYVGKSKIDLVKEDVSDITSNEVEIFREKKLSPSKDNVNNNERGEESNTYGGVPWKVYWNFFNSGANTFGILMIPVLDVICAAFYVGSDYWLKVWSDMQSYNLISLNQSGHQLRLKNESNPQVLNLSSECSTFASFSDVPRCHISQSYFLTIFSFLVLITCFTGVLTSMYDYIVCVRAAKKLHDNMFNRMLQVPMYFFNVNPIGRILNRFVQDVGNVDDLLPTVFTTFTGNLRVNIAALIVICIQNYYLMFVVCFMAFLYLPTSYIYCRTYQTLKRINSSTKSPIFSHISTSLDGRTSIRAFNATETCKNALCKLQNHNIASSFMFFGADSWFAFTGDFIGSITMCIATAIPVFLTPSSKSGTVGFILSQIAIVAGTAQYTIRLFSQIQSEFTSVERITEYGNLTPEAPKQSSLDRKPGHSWPERGIIEFKSVCLRYKQTDPYVLKSISFKIKSKEKIGIVGRTGSGKTSLVNSLFRLTEPEGIIEIDGVVVNNIGLHDLRHKLSVIPQEPLLFADTLRYNLDPFHDHDDFTLWNALTDVGLEKLVAAFPDKLNTMIGGKTNLSFGQSQLICLARAILKKNRILVLDEATSNVDHCTDALIQQTIRSKFEECTVLTIAHRLNTVLDSDRILVMDEGNIIEFDSPFVLANNTSSKFYEMIQDTGPAAETLLRRACSQNVSRMYKDGAVRSKTDI